MEYPNSVFIVDHISENEFGRVKHTILVVGDTKETVVSYIEEKLGMKNSNPIYISNCKYPTIYNQTGTKPEIVQAKILYNTTSWVK